MLIKKIERWTNQTIWVFAYAYEKQKMIFESFTQADGDTTRKYGGTGLGLTITRQLTELMGGSLTLTSELDKGSVFSMIIPAGVEANLRSQATL